MKTATEARVIFRKLAAQHPNANTELHYSNPFELLVATILSAQTTDVGVNEATPALFARYPDAGALAAANPPELERLVQRTGFFRQKTRALIGMAQGLLACHGGQVPAAMNDLIKLPGVGRKTANVVLGHALGVPGLPVDRHVLRVTNRIGLAQSEDPEVVEQQLGGLLPAHTWTVASDTFILHGRRVCKPKPMCDRCAVRDECDDHRRRAGLHPAAPARPRATTRRGGTEPRSSKR